jgi:ParB-like chromosome segregation protein Spo0J
MGIMAKKLVADVSADVETLPEIHRRSIPLSEVKRIAPSDLTSNAKNAEYFEPEEEAYLQLLREDIRKRGILVPLIAKRDGTLLAGHNRLLLAQELHLKTVPVQYVQEELSDDKEREFIINDNLLRRHLSLERRIHLYKLRYSDFEQRFLNPETLSKAGRKKSDDTATTLEQIAKDTGQSVSAVRMQVKRIRDAQSAATTKNHHNVMISSLKNNDVKNSSEKKNSHNKKQATKNHHNVMISNNTSESLIGKTRRLIEELALAHPEEREEALRLLRGLFKNDDKKSHKKF